MIEADTVRGMAGDYGRCRRNDRQGQRAKQDPDQFKCTLVCHCSPSVFVLSGTRRAPDGFAVPLEFCIVFPI